MERYELMDIGATYADLLSTGYKFWTTTTFALVAAAYVAGPELGTWISIGIATVYLSLSIGNLFTVRLYTQTIVGTVKDLAVLSEEDDGEWETLKPIQFIPVGSTAPMLLAVMASGSVGSVIYLFQRVGFFG